MRLLLIDGSSAEVSELLNRFPDLRGGGQNTDWPGERSSASSGRTGASYWTVDSVQRLVSELWGKQKQFVRLIMQDKGAIGYNKVLASLGFKKGQQLSGIRSGITRNARRVTGFKKAEFVLWRRRFDTDWEGEYYIHPDAYEILTNSGLKL